MDGVSLASSGADLGANCGRFGAEGGQVVGGLVRRRKIVGCGGPGAGDFSPAPPGKTVFGKSAATLTR